MGREGVAVVGAACGADGAGVACGFGGAGFIAVGEGDDGGAACDGDIDGGAEGEDIDDDQYGDVGFEGDEAVEAPFGEDAGVGVGWWGHGVG